MSAIDDAAGWLTERDSAVWGASLLFYGVGDAVTTTAGIATGTAREVGPLAAPLTESFGVAGILGLKIVVLLAFYALWRVATRPDRIAIPTALAVVGVAVTTWNLVVLL